MYTVVGIAIYKYARTDRVLAALYVGGWVVNLLWIPLFAGSASMFSPLWILLLLLLTMLLMVRLRNTVRHPFWALLVPYAVWLGVASVLGFEIARNN